MLPKFFACISFLRRQRVYISVYALAFEMLVCRALNVNVSPIMWHEYSGWHGNILQSKLKSIATANSADAASDNNSCMYAIDPISSERNFCHINSHEKGHEYNQVQHRSNHSQSCKTVKAIMCQRTHPHPKTRFQSLLVLLSFDPVFHG